MYFPFSLLPCCFSALLPRVWSWPSTVFYQWIKQQLKLEALRCTDHLHPHLLLHSGFLNSFYPFKGFFFFFRLNSPQLDQLPLLPSSLAYPFLWLPGWLSGKESTCQCRRHLRRRFDPWVGKIPWRRKWQSTPVFLPGKSHATGGLQSMGLQRVRHDWTRMHIPLFDRFYW